MTNNNLNDFINKIKKIEKESNDDYDKATSEIFEYIENTCEEISYGSSRTVFGIDDKTVIKIEYDYDLESQNENELKNSKIFDIHVPKIYYYSSSNCIFWLISEKCKSLQSEQEEIEWLKKVGIDDFELNDITYTYSQTQSPLYKWIRNIKSKIKNNYKITNPLELAIVDAYDSNIVIDEFRYRENVGFSLIDGRPVIIDTGL